MSTHQRKMPRALKSVLVALTAGALVAGMAACSSDSGSSGSSDASSTSSADAGGSEAPSEAPADADGSLTYGVMGNENDATYPYSEATSSSGTMLRYELYDKLTNYDRDGNLQMMLAKSFTPNADFTEWDVALRDDVKMSDGSMLTADDVVFSFDLMFNNTEHPSTVPNLLSMVDPAGVTAKDEHTVHFKLTREFAPLPDLMAYQDVVIAGKATTFENPVGSGPFKATSFTANREAQLVRNDDYWGAKPGFKDLKIVYFQDEDAILNALLSGQIDVAYQINGNQVQQVEGAGKQLLRSDAGSYPMIEMQIDQPPFDDVRVRHAFQLMVDRNRVVENAFGGEARLGNDYVAGGDTCPAPDIPQREQDLAKAKQLLEEAGVTQKEFTITTDGVFPGMMESAQVLAQGAAEIGITINVQKLPIADFLNKWGEWPFFINLSDPPYIVGVFDHFSATGVNNTTNFSFPEFDELLKKIETTSDPAALCGLITESHQFIYENGAEIIAAIPQRITAFDAKVQGLTADKQGRSSYMFDGVTVTS